MVQSARAWPDLGETAAGPQVAAERHARRTGFSLFRGERSGRPAHDKQVPPAPRGRIPASANLKERTARKPRTKPGRAAHSRRTPKPSAQGTGRRNGTPERTPSAASQAPSGRP